MLKQLKFLLFFAIFGMLFIVGCTKDENSISQDFSEVLLDEFANEIVSFKRSILENKLAVKQNYVKYKANTANLGNDLFVGTNVEIIGIKNVKFQEIFKKMNSDIDFSKEIAIRCYNIEKGQSNLFNHNNLEIREWGDCHDKDTGGIWVFVQIGKMAGGIAACSTGPGCVLGAVSIIDSIGNLSKCGWW